MKKLTLFLVFVFLIALAFAQSGPPRPKRDDGIVEGFIIKEYARDPLRIVYHSDTLSFESCTDSWNKLLDEVPELRPVVIDHGIDYLQVYGLHCVEVDVIER